MSLPMKKITRAFKQAKIIVRLVLLTFLMHSSYCDIWYDASRCCQEPIDRSCNYPISLSRRFHRPIYSYCLNLSRIQIPAGTSVTNCNHKHGLILVCRHDVDKFTRGRIVLSSPKRAHVNWNWPISREKYLKIDWSVKMPLPWLIMGVAGS